MIFKHMPLHLIEDSDQAQYEIFFDAADDEAPIAIKTPGRKTLAFTLDGFERLCTFLMEAKEAISKEDARVRADNPTWYETESEDSIPAGTGKPISPCSVSHVAVRREWPQR